MRKIMNKIMFNLIYSLFKNKLTNIESYLFHSKIAFKVHEKMITNLKLKGSFKTPEDLTIISYHNYKNKPLFERSMDFLGLEYLSIKADTPYYFSKKTELIYSMIKNGEIKTKYVLICDSDDVIFTKDPKDIIKVFEDFRCDILFCSTDWDFVRKTTYDKNTYSDGFPQGLVMKEQKDWVNNVLGQNKYINCGAYIFKTNNILDILEESIKYITYDKESELGFPYSNSDQTIYRWIEPKFYPRIKVDYDNKLFTHNMPKNETF